MLLHIKLTSNAPGDYILLDETSHPLKTQSGSIGGLVNANPLPIKGERGIFDVHQIRKFIKVPTLRNIPKVSIISIEQTTNFGGGAVWPLINLKEIYQLAVSNSVAVHLDGARLFNAHIASGISVKEYCKYADSVFIDFTKGLGCPLGAVLLGSKEFIEKCWYYKFQLGGGMHQVGMLAAACIYSLENKIERLKEDHMKAKLLAELLSQNPHILINEKLYETNIIYFTLSEKAKISLDQLIIKLAENRIRMLQIQTSIRAITHMNISFDDIYHTNSVITQILNREL